MRLYLDSCVLIYALDGAEQLRRHTLQQLERYGDAFLEVITAYSR